MSAREEGWTQQRDAKGAHAVWTALKMAKKALRSTEIAALTKVSEPYVRKVLRQWSQAGAVVRTDDGGYAYRMAENAPDEPPILTAKGVVIERGAVFMTHDEFATIRRMTGLTLADFGIALGRAGKRANVAAEMNHYERGNRPIGAATASKVRSLGSEALALPRKK